MHNAIYEVSVKIASLSSHALVSCSVLGQLSIKTIVVDIYSSTHLISVDTNKCWATAVVVEHHNGGWAGRLWRGQA